MSPLQGVACAVALLACSALALPMRTIQTRAPDAPRVPLPDAASRYGLSFSATGRTVSLRHSLAEISMEADSRQIRFNGTLVWLNDAIRAEGGKWSISAADSAAVLAPLLDPQCAPPIRSPATVALDPGHGGNDTGARARGIPPEKSMTLAIVKLVEDKLRCSGISVVTTRDRDADLPLAERSQAARRCAADMFVSVHLNAATNPAVAGVETYLLPATGFDSTLGRSRDTDRAPGNSHDAASQLLAYDVHRALLARSGAMDRGIRRARFEVLVSAPCPAILVECGFMSNPREAASMTTSEYQARIADGITHGVLSYLSRCEAQSRRREPTPSPGSTPEGSSRENVRTGSTDRAVQAPLQGGTAR